MNLIATENLLALKKEWSRELKAVLSYWMNHTVDVDNGGFYGSVNNYNEPDKQAAKGLVMHSRILWTFSAAYAKRNDPQYLETADRAFQFLRQYFVDKKYGGMFWSVDAKGRIQDDKKQVYGLAFAMYGLSEYYKASGNNIALNLAIDMYYQIERYSFDTKYNGYVEAFTRDWKEMGDLRLSEKDNNDRKTMNTHLHVIEGYANLYTIWPNAKLKAKIENLLFLFDTYFVDHQSHHLRLFFNDQWESQSSLQSYGHDIEAAWLLQQCAEIIESPEWIMRFKELALPITNAAAEGLDEDGGLWYEYEAEENILIKEKHSWPQAEAMIGFMNAYDLTHDDAYLQKLIRNWDFIKHHIRDEQGGEWYWGVYADYSLMEKDKAGFWKCPYHNGRSMLELMDRMDRILNE
ncbi:MAG TPA: AGE family epimerase/isomerase [Phnomibacter sp.]|nr:AGE family epimerase/isomerase [Phnomibacter sp.]